MEQEKRPMSHVDDGTLHAYLDGALSEEEPTRDELEAHLGVCADCRVRLEVALADRDRSREILGLLAPHEILTPPFEEMLARREAREAPGRPGTRGGSGRGSRRMGPARLAWAASILLALGGGWMARGAMFSWSDADPAAPGTVAEAPASGVEDRLQGMTEGTAEAAYREGDLLARMGTGPERDPPRADPAGTEPPAIAGRPEVDRPETETTAPAEPAPVVAETAAPAEPLPVVADAAAAPKDTARTGLAPMIVTGARSLRMAPMTTAAAREEVVLAPAPRLDEAARERSADPPDGHDPVYSLAAADLFAMEAEAGARDAWTAVSPAEAARRLGHPPLELEGLPWERMEVAVLLAEAIIRTWHPLADGGWAVVVQASQDLLLSDGARALAFERRMKGDLHPGVDRPEPGAGAGTPARWVRDGLVAAIRGPADPDELEALLRRLR
jgi:hypothetical protein